MPQGKDNRSPSQVAGDPGGGVAEMGGEMYFSNSVPPPAKNLLHGVGGWADEQLPDGTGNLGRYPGAGPDGLNHPLVRSEITEP
jgi:hypothetical protein